MTTDTSICPYCGYLCTCDKIGALLHDIRALRDLIRETGIAYHECDNHYQAGYDTGYADQYQAEQDRLRSIYHRCGDKEDALVSDMIERYHFSCLLQSDRVYDIAWKFA
jgi:hypothetical protein